MGVVTLSIHDLEGGCLAFDLRDILRLLAPLSLKAIWTVTSEEEAFEATGEGGMRLEDLAKTSAKIDGDDLLAIADSTQQVIWGDFMGVLPDHPHRVWLTIRAIDSSFYEITSSDEASLARIKSSFRDVRIVSTAT